MFIETGINVSQFLPQSVFVFVVITILNLSNRVPDKTAYDIMEKFKLTEADKN